MILCMVTPHLPPDQAANALLPQLLSDALVADGHEVRLVAFDPGEDRSRRADVHYVRRPANGWSRTLRLAHIETGLGTRRAAREAFDHVDVVHIHSNTFMNQVASVIAHRRGVPFLLTHYGTEIWHYRRRVLDPFLWMNEHAFHVTYYSRLLLARSLDLGVVPRRRSVIYPAVERRFRPPTPEERNGARQALGLGEEPTLLNVKRLHPLAGQRFLVEAMPAIRARFPGARLILVGEGEERHELENLIAALGLGHQVTLAGPVDHRELPRYYHASDLFVLPSRLEAFPTVAAEALASGLPVVSSDSPGGLELEELFPGDVTIVPRETVEPLAHAVSEALERRAPSSEATRARIERELRPEAVVGAYLSLYRRAVEKNAGARD